MEYEEHSTVRLTDSSSVQSFTSSNFEVRSKDRLQLENLNDNREVCETAQRGHSALQNLVSPTPSAESFTDTTNSSFATPPFSLSPVGEAPGLWSKMSHFDDISLPLPVITFVTLPPPRDLTVLRQKSPRNDFGFSLRKAICLDRTSSVLTPAFKPVIFAEPGTMGNATGLLPGDRLLKVNGVCVEDLARETIIEMIRNSGNSVQVQVQPVNELVELSKRCMPSGMWNNNNSSNSSNGNSHTNGCDEADRLGTSVSKYNTLRRSASTRFKTQVSVLPVLNELHATITGYR